MTRTFLPKHINTNLSTAGAISNSFGLFAPILGRMSVVTVHLKPPLESKLRSLCQCLMEHTRHQQVCASTLLRKNLLLFKWHISAFCVRLHLEWAQPAPAGGSSAFGLFT